MSTLYSNPSPSKAGMSTKRPYESTTPSNLGTPRDTSNQGSGRSPGPNKKARSNGEEGREVGKGGQWMIAQLDELQRMYKVSPGRYGVGARADVAGGFVGCYGCYSVSNIRS